MKREIVVRDGVPYGGRQDMRAYDWKVLEDVIKETRGSYPWRKRMAMQLVRHGSTRIVFLIGNYAIKIPDWTCEWRLFLLGLVANMQERVFWTTKWAKLCPIVFSLPGGWLVVMRRAVPLTEAEFALMDVDWLNEENGVVPCEFKQNSFGWLDGRIVAIDYGN